MTELVPLQYLASGNRGTVMHVLGNPEQVQRFREMGIRDGAEIQMIRGGTTCIFRTGTQTLCVRGNDSLSVLVQTGASV
jgi:Fe2+ transport system protein FeoA